MPDHTTQQIETVEVVPQVWGSPDWVTSAPASLFALEAELEKYAYDGVLWRLVAAARSLRNRGGVDWTVEVVETGYDDHDIHGGPWTLYRVHAESSGGVWSSRAYRWAGAVQVSEDHYGRLGVWPGGDGEAIVVSGKTGEATRFTGSVVGSLLADAFRQAAMQRIAAAALPDGPIKDPIKTGEPLEATAWLQQVLEHREPSADERADTRASRAQKRDEAVADQRRLAAAFAVATEVWERDGGYAIARTRPDLWVEARPDRTAANWADTNGWGVRYTGHEARESGWMPQGYGAEMEARWKADSLAAKRAEAVKATAEQTSAEPLADWERELLEASGDDA